ncbi:MAG: hypothetical protein JST01_13900 [Cyanobacteria bacterium SZAS TMP-1]|nr:hypothetical protein [Cyanobacteria bacterium SZAS TMP-1]
MADISDHQPLKLSIPENSCVGKLLDDSKPMLAPGPHKIEHIGLHKGPDPQICLNYLSVSADSPLPAKTARSTAFQTEGPIVPTGDKAVVKAYLGVASSLAPGQPLAFDTDFRRLDFSTNENTAANPVDISPPRLLKFDNKLSGALVIGVNMRF